MRLAIGSEGAFKLSFALLLIVAALGFTYIGSDGDFPPAESYLVLLHTMAVDGVLLVGTLVLPWGRRASNATLALVTVAGIFTGYVVHTALFHPENRIWMIVMLAASVFTLFTAFRVIESVRYGGIVLTGAAVLAVAAAGWPAFGPKLLSGMSVPGGLLYAGSPAMWILLVVAVAGVALVLYALSRRGVRPLRSGGLALVAAVSFIAMLVVVLRFES